MTLVWTESSKEDLEKYKRESKIINVSEYIEKLIDYIDFLKTNPRLGKILFTFNEKEIRQLIYKMHRILYFIDENNISILIVSHMNRDMDEIISYLKRNLL